MRDLQTLPKLADSLSYLYAEHCIVEKAQQAIEFFDQDGATRVPAAALSVLLLGPGTRITHAAVTVLADSGCTIVWVGEDGTRCYAQGGGETRKGYQLLHQARLASDPQLRLEVCKRMYRMRFDEDLDPDLTIEQLRGMEGARVRSAYATLSIVHGVRWHGRSYDRASWGNSDPINRAISAANALLNGLCHAAIVSAGYAPGLGFIHTGKQLSFVYDIADLYKVEITLPVAFSLVGRSSQRVEPRVRKACRQAFKNAKLLKRIVPDIQHLLDLPDDILSAGPGADADPGRPEPLWTPPPALEPDPVDRADQAARVASSERTTPESAVASSPVSASEVSASEVSASAASQESDASDSMSPTGTAEPGIDPIPSPAPESVLIPARPLSPADDAEREAQYALAQRRARARRGLEGSWQITPQAPDTWCVITRPQSDGYTVQQHDSGWTCTCPDYANTGLGACKHTLAVELLIQEQAADADADAEVRVEEVSA
jgi:CRISP-associated protein Cas1